MPSGVPKFYPRIAAGDEEYQGFPFLFFRIKIAMSWGSPQDDRINGDENRD